MLLLCIRTPKLLYECSGQQVVSMSTGHFLLSSVSCLRVSLDGTGVLHISSPSVEDQGVYQCTAANELGSDTQSSQLFMAGETHMLNWGVTQYRVTDGNGLRSHRQHYCLTEWIRS